MGKKKKNRDKDFQKVKLKVGKKLLKGTNETDTSFKAKKIVIAQQLKTGNKDFHEPTTLRKQTVNDLLSRLEHYSISVRHDSLTGLKDLLTDHSEIIVHHLSPLIEKVPLLATDNDGSVRKATLTVLKLIMQNAPKEKLSSMHSIMAAQLCCAMSHLNLNVQFDSLFFLDVFLEYCPEMILLAANSILPNFVNQISKPKNSKGNNTRMLSMDLSSNITSQKLRNNILLRLNNVLKIVLSSEISKVKPFKTIEWSSCPQHGINTFHYGKLNVKLSLKNGNIDSYIANQKMSYKLSEFLSEVLPLLFETWIEVAATRSKSMKNVIHGHELSILECILGIFYQLVHYMKLQNDEKLKLLLNFESEISQNFITIFYESFPFSFQKESQQKTKKRKRSDHNLVDYASCENSCLQINLMICYVILSMSCTDSQFCIYVSSPKQYLNNALKKKHLSPSHIDLIISTVKMMVAEKYQYLDEILLNLLSALEQIEYLSNGFFSIFKYFQNFFESHFNTQFDEINIRILTFIVDKIEQDSWNPEMLEVSVDIFTSILKCKNPDVTDIISSCLPDLLMIQNRIKNKNWRKLCNLFYWCNFDENFLKMFIEWKRTNQVSLEFTCLFITFLKLRQENMTLPVSDSVYCKFMFSVLVEPSTDDISSDDHIFLEHLTKHWNINVGPVSNINLEWTPLAFSVSRAVNIFSAANNKFVFNAFLDKLIATRTNFTVQSYFNLLQAYVEAGLNFDPIPSNVITISLIILATLVEIKNESSEIVKFIFEILNICNKQLIFHYFLLLITNTSVDLSHLLKNIIELFTCLFRLSIFDVKYAEAFACEMQKRYFDELQNVKQWKEFLCEINIRPQI